MKNQIKLTEEELRHIIQEAIHQQLNEWNPFKNVWNKLKGKNSHNYRNYDNDYETPQQDGWDPHSYQSENNENEPEVYNAPIFTPGEGEEENSNPVIFDNQSDEEPQPAETISEPEPTNTPNETNSTLEPTQETEPQSTYQRGKDYRLTFNQENENIFNNYITPAYNAANNAIRYLQNLERLGEFAYSQAAKNWDDYGTDNNKQGAQKNYKAVCQQINSIMPTLNNIKAEMKNILYANGIRQSGDYQHYNMEESIMRNIIHNSIQKILKESVTRNKKR